MIVADARHLQTEVAETRRWTALEVFTAIAPHRVSRLPDPQTAFLAETRRAHVVAVAMGHHWDAQGRYPLDIWMLALR